jgi:hypothetical protein
MLYTLHLLIRCPDVDEKHDVKKSVTKGYMKVVCRCPQRFLSWAVKQMYCVMGSPTGREERKALSPASTLEVTKTTA